MLLLILCFRALFCLLQLLHVTNQVKRSKNNTPTQKERAKHNFQQTPDVAEQKTLQTTLGCPKI